LALAEADLRAVLPTITVPTLLLYGTADARAPRPVAEALHAAIPNSELVLLPEGGRAEAGNPQHHLAKINRICRFG